MKKFNFIVVIFVASILSCKKDNVVDCSEGEYLMAYKKSVFYECVNSATNGNLYKFSDENNDLGTATEVAVIYHSDLEHAKEVGIRMSSKIRKIDYSDYNGKRPIFSDCIEFAFSEHVDSIAKHKYRILQSSKIEYEE